MAVSVISQPQLIQPVYNPLYIRVSGTNTTQDSFAYVFDTYVNGVFATRDRLQVRPNTNEAVYSPARVLESYLSYDKSIYSALTPSNSSNTALKYEVKIGEEYITDWTISEITRDTISGTTLMLVSGSTNHSYSVGDKIVIDGTEGSQFDGVFEVKYVPNTKALILDVDFLSVATLNYNPTFINAAYWDTNNNWTITNGKAYCVNSNEGSLAQSNFLTTGKRYEIQMTIDAITGTTNVYIGGGSMSAFTTTGLKTFQLTATGDDIEVFPTTAGSVTLDSLYVYRVSGLTGTTSYLDGRKSIFSGLTTVSGYTFNGVLQYEEVPTWNYSNYVPSGTSKSFLTNRPDYATVRLDDYGHIAVLNYNTNLIDGSDFPQVEYGITTQAGVTTLYRYNLTALTTTITADNLIVGIPSHPKSINAMAGMEKIGESTKSYYIRIVYNTDASPSVYTTISESKYFTVDTKCTKYEPIQFMFLGRFGQFEYFTATLLSRETVNINRTSFKKPLAYNYNVGDRGTSVINVDATQTFICNTDWIKEDVAAWLVEMATSNEVYIINSDATLTPIVLDFGSYEPKKRVNDGLISYTFSYQKALPLNTIRG